MSTTRRSLRRLAVGAIALATAVMSATVPQANAAEPINVALATNPGGNAPEIALTHINAGSPQLLNDGVIGDNKNWNAWGESSGTTVTLTWPYYVEVTKATFVAWTDSSQVGGGGGVYLPSAIEVQAYDKESDSYLPVKLTGETPAMPAPEMNKRDYPITRDFEKVKTSSIKFTFPNQNRPVGATEVQVFGENTSQPVAEPDPIDPGDPAAYLETEQVELRTTPGALPEFPEEIWATYEATAERAAENKAPLVNDLAVTWDTSKVKPADYDAAGDSFKVTGTLDDSGAPVEATVNVFDSLSNAITDIDFVSTITTPGIAPVFPDTVTAIYEDGSRESGQPATWSAPAASDFDKAEDFGLVDATAAAKSYEGYGAFFVVAAAPVDALPVLLLDFQSGSLAPSGWHTALPTVIVKADRGVSNSAIEKLEYCVSDCGQTGAGWADYTFPVLIDQQGTVGFKARATDSEGRVGHSEVSFKVDSHAPTTAETHTVKGRNAVIELAASDAIQEVDGSGVTRTVWSSGPSSNSNSSENVMWGTYNPDEKVQLQLSTTRVTYLHFRSEDAAGNSEKVKTISFQPVDEPDPVDPTTVIANIAGTARVGTQWVTTGTIAPAVEDTVVWLQRQNAEGTWLPVAQATTDAAGNFRIVSTPAVGGQIDYRVSVSENGDHSAVDSDPVSVTVRQASTANANIAATARVGVDWVTTGNVSPARAGSTVWLQRRSGDAWLPVAKATTEANGRFRIVSKPAVAGTIDYRVSLAADGHFLAAVSPASPVNISQPTTTKISAPKAAKFQSDFRVTGSVSPAKAGTIVWLQRQDAAGAWLPVAKATVAQNGQFSITSTARVRGNVSFRVSTASNAPALPSVSSTVIVQVS